MNLYSVYVLTVMREKHQSLHKCVYENKVTAEASLSWQEIWFSIVLGWIWTCFHVRRQTAGRGSHVTSCFCREEQDFSTGSEERSGSLSCVWIWCVTRSPSLHASQSVLRTRLFCSCTSLYKHFYFKGINLFSSVVLTDTFIKFCKVWIFIYHIEQYYNLCHYFDLE